MHVGASSKTEARRRRQAERRSRRRTAKSTLSPTSRSNCAMISSRRSASRRRVDPRVARLARDVTGEKLAAFEGPEVPDTNLPTWISPWSSIARRLYEFPLRRSGQGAPQPTVRRPTLTLYADYLGEKIPLADSERRSAAGGPSSSTSRDVEVQGLAGRGARLEADRCGTGVARAPGTPVRTLVIRDLKSKTGYGVNCTSSGRVTRRPTGSSRLPLAVQGGEDGEVELMGDEGIRTHGSSTT